MKKDLPAGDENATKSLGSSRLNTVFAGGTDGTSLRNALALASVQVCREAQLAHRRLVAIAMERWRSCGEGATIRLRTANRRHPLDGHRGANLPDIRAENWGVHTFTISTKSP